MKKFIQDWLIKKLDSRLKETFEYVPVAAYEQQAKELAELRETIKDCSRRLHAAEDREFRATRAMQNTQAVMTPHLTGKTRVASVGNHRIQLDIPSYSDIDPYLILAGFAHMLADSDLPLDVDKWPTSLPELTAKLPPLITPSSPALKAKRMECSTSEPEWNKRVLGPYQNS